MDLITFFSVAYFIMFCALLFIAEYLQVIPPPPRQSTLCNWAVDEQIDELISCNKNFFLCK